MSRPDTLPSRELQAGTSTQRSESDARAEPVHLNNAPPRRADLGLLIIAAAFLLGGAAYKRYALGSSRTVSLVGNTIEANLPQGWVARRAKNRAILELPSLASFSPTIRVERWTKAQGPIANLPLDIAMTQLERRGATLGAAYRVLATEEKRAFGGQNTMWTHFALAQDPPDTQPGAAVLPTVISGVEVLFTHRNHTYHLAASAPADQFEDPGHVIHEVIASLRAK